jgi:hypothetical protein
MGIAAGIIFLSACGGGGGSTAQFGVRTISADASRVTGGDVLTEISLPANADRKNVLATLNGKDVTAQFTDYDAQANTLKGLLSGLTTDTTSANGSANLLVVSASDNSVKSSQLRITNYPITGPVLSGPHMTPYECRTIQSGLGAPLDADCTATSKTAYYYRTTAKNFKLLADPGATTRPSDLSTTVANGTTVPYIVRVESGTNNRSIYRIAVLDNPTAATVQSNSWAGKSIWNKKVVVSFGGGCGSQYNQGTNTEATALDDLTLSKGYAFIASTEHVNQQHCNPYLQGEALMMLKEYFAERYGVPKWTIGTGVSGGAKQQHLIAQLFPGLLDGIQPGLSFPDTMSMDFMYCTLLGKFYKEAGAATWTQSKQNAVNGYEPGTCELFDALNLPGYVNALTGPVSPLLASTANGDIVCGLLDQSKKFDPATNPTGARCDVYTGNVNALGRNPATGLVRRPLDNIGVQFGLAALNSGAISVAEFLDLNERIGGFDINGLPSSQRHTGDPDGIRMAYATGLSNSFKGIAIPIVTNRVPSNGTVDIHDRLQDMVVRERILKANGRADNRIVLTAKPASGINLSEVSLDIISRWLDAIAADPAPASIEKTVKNKPADAVDTCWKQDGTKLIEPATPGANLCNAEYPLAQSPMLVAGVPLSKDVFKCALKPVSDSDYKVSFSTAEKQRLATIFPQGVCDWTKPSQFFGPLRGTYMKLPIE